MKFWSRLTALNVPFLQIQSVAEDELIQMQPESSNHLENLDLSGTKEEIASTLSRVPGLTKNQVNLLVDVAASLAV